MASRTLAMIAKHFTVDLNSKEMTSIELPFNLEEFCRENDSSYDYLMAECLRLRGALDKGSKHLDDIKYECYASVYTLEDDEMGTMFFVRDYMMKALEAFDKWRGK